MLWLLPEGGYYTYAHDPGASGQPTVAEVTSITQGVDAEVVYLPGRVKTNPSDPSTQINVYEGPTPILLQLRNVGSSLSLSVQVKLLLCSETSCWPVDQIHSMSWSDLDTAALPSASAMSWWPDYLEAGGAAPQDVPSLQEAADELAAEDSLPAFAPRYFQPGLEVKGLGKAIAFALLAGLILNCMPCVLPVVSLKLSALMTASGVTEEERKTNAFRQYNLWFALGMLTYFFLLSVLLGGADLAWGQLFQRPSVVLGLTVALFCLALSLFGLFTLPVIDLKTPMSACRSPRFQAWATGVLATLLATPCSGPFLGGVLGWVLLQPPVVVSVVFLCIGLGTAMPYLLLAAKPGLVRYFPKPGPWTLHLERIVGFFLIGTCIYLLNILPDERVKPALFILFAAAFCAWLSGGCVTLSQCAARRWTVRGVAAALFVAASIWILRVEAPEVAWDTYDAGQFGQILGRENLLLDFTADWCPTCAILKETALKDRNLMRWRARYGLRFIKVDLTQDDPDAMALLRALGSQSIPVVAIFPRGEDKSRPMVLRDLFSAGQMDGVLRSLFDSRR